MKPIIFILTSLLATAAITTGQTEYRNDKYGFSAGVPKDWKINNEVKDEAGARGAISWSLPKVSSEIEQGSVENVVSITAYKLPEINSMEDVIKYEIRRMGGALQSVKPVEDTLYTSYIMTNTTDNVKYQTMQSYVFKNGIGYAIMFTATPGTYEINVSKFESFIKDVKFFEPGEQQPATPTSK